MSFDLVTLGLEIHYVNHTINAKRKRKYDLMSLMATTELFCPFNYNCGWWVSWCVCAGSFIGSIPKKN